MINYIEKGDGLHAAIASAGHWIREENGVWTSSDDVSVQGIIDNYRPLPDAIISMQEKIAAYAAAIRNHITAGVSPAEMASWSIKRAEVLAYAASGNSADAPMLSAEAVARGGTLQSLIASIAEKARNLSALEAQIAGNSWKHRDAVANLTSFEDALNYDFSSGWPV